jgi:tetratricopeptide (TPR) repeat protein
MAQGALEEALQNFQDILAQAPGREKSLTGAASVSQALGHKDEAISCWRRVIVVNPYKAFYQASLARLLAQQQQWRAAAEPSRKWRELEPESIEARKLWIRGLLQAGDRKEAQAELQRIQRMAPSRARELRDWFEDVSDL